MPIITSVTKHPIDYYHKLDENEIENIVKIEMSRDISNLIIEEALLDWNFTNENDFRKFELKGFVMGYKDFSKLIAIIKENIKNPIILNELSSILKQ